MAFFRCLVIVFAAVLTTGCATKIAPNYDALKPDIMRIGGERPDVNQPRTENAGSYCVVIADSWHQDGETPDGQKLWAKDTVRRVVPCR